MEVEDENCDIQKTEICSNEDEEHMEDPTVNIILIVELHMTNESMNNNNRNEGFGKQRSKDELSRLSTESTEVFTQSSRVFTQTSDLVTKSVEKLV
jgi:hypothetical protein